MTPEENVRELIPTKLAGCVAPGCGCLLIKSRALVTRDLRKARLQSWPKTNFFELGYPT